MESKDRPNETGNIINNDQSKLFDGCLGTSFNNGIVAPQTNDNVGDFNNLVEGYEGRGYDNVRGGLEYRGSHFSNAVLKFIYVHV